MRVYASSSPIPAVIGVFVMPGATAVTLTSYGPRSAADARVNPTIAALEAAYTAGDFVGRKAALELRFTMRPPAPRSAICLPTARVSRNGAFTLLVILQYKPESDKSRSWWSL